MRLYLVRHGEPNYELDCLTENGKIQAEKAADVLQNVKFDKVYCSSQGRAHETCMATCRRINMEPIVVDWAREDLGGQYFGIIDPDNRWTWIFWSKKYGPYLRNEEVMKLGRYWYKSPYFQDTKVEEGVKIMNKSVDEFMLENGYKHDRDNCQYIKVGDTPDTIILFAHGGFGVSFLSSLLDIPYNVFSTSFQHFDLTGITTIDFNGDNCRPIVIRYNDIHHLD